VSTLVAICWRNVAMIDFNAGEQESPPRRGGGGERQWGLLEYEGASLLA
jgi:hypothetical protein